jgi:hypothetical protein
MQPPRAPGSGLPAARSPRLGYGWNHLSNRPIHRRSCLLDKSKVEAVVRDQAVPQIKPVQVPAHDADHFNRLASTYTVHRIVNPLLLPLALSVKAFKTCHAPRNTQNLHGIGGYAR